MNFPFFKKKDDIQNQFDRPKESYGAVLALAFSALFGFKGGFSDDCDAVEIIDLLSACADDDYEAFSDVAREERMLMWQDAPYVLDRTVDVHIARIRAKLGVCKAYLTNRSGYGYTFNVVE